MNTTETNRTQQLLIESFEELMLVHPFKKITVKMITDGAGVIRPTFYNHFRDKYEIFEVILDTELMEPLYGLVDIDMTKEASKMIFTYFGKKRAFYEKAFKVTGQNSFRSILIRKITDLFFHSVDQKEMHIAPEVAALTKEQIVEFTATNLVLIIEMWLLGDISHKISADQIFEAYLFLMTHNLEDLFEEE